METIIEVLKNRKDKKIVFTNGCFDIIHYGHVYLLKEAKSLGDILIVGLNSDSSIKKLKGTSRPFFSDFFRKSVLESIRYVDYVIIFDEETPLNLIKNILPDVIVKGGDYTVSEVVGKDIVRDNGGEVIIIPRVENFSTTSILRGDSSHDKKGKSDSILFTAVSPESSK